MVPFGEALWLWRVEKGLTQEELASAAGISRPNLSAMEQGKREVTLKTLRALAAALGIRPGVLADGLAPVLEKSATPLSREAMERIADGVTRGAPVRTEQERSLVNLLREMVRHRLSAARSREILHRGKRAMDAAWLSLNASYPPQVVRSLLQRLEDRLRLK